MKLKVKETSYAANPKQDEGKLLVRYHQFTVKPKPRGVKIYQDKLTAVLKHDRRIGVLIQKVKNNKILKQWD
jgi:hypothetical protein